MSSHKLFTCFIIFVTFNAILSDIYLHNPRGSNNRHNENTPDRKNPNLSFDSENNNRGGYNVGDDGTMYYYTKSILPIQWTNQHSCNDVNADCALILQYTCSDTLRDGTTTDTIPDTLAGANDPKYRLTESFTSYLNCRVRSRDKSLFTANQGLKGNSAIYTRQNPQGTRYGYECPEERDYYPHWQPNDWIDIAVLTNRQDLCAYYRENSQNVQARYACTFTNQDDLIKADQLKIILPNNKQECEAFNNTAVNGAKPRWIQFPSKNKPPPECYTPSYTRENHLGDVRGSEMSTFNWTLPDTATKKCVLRVRYNISTSDYDGWNIDSVSNAGNYYVMNEYFPNNTAAEARGYRYGNNNPQIQLFDGVNFKLQLAVNTAQYGRVFEDRSFIFEVRQRPAAFSNKTVYNLNVRGRRGNIVQVFPAVEYDFVPSRLEMSPDSYVHIQWIGSNTTPAGAGQGQVQNDRNNLLLLKHKVLNSNWNPYESLNYTGLLNANYPENLTNANFLNLPLNDLRLLAAAGPYSDTLLNGAKAYFDLGARLVSASSIGIYHYVSTRNNDFSNRDQKGRITVLSYKSQYQLIGQNGYTAYLDDAIITFPQGSVETSVPVRYAKFSLDQLSTIVPENGQNIAKQEKLYGNVYIIEPSDFIFSKNIEFQIPFEEFDGHEKDVDVLQFEPHKGVYLKLPYKVDTDSRMLKFQSDIGGIYVFAGKRSSPIWIAAVVVPIVLVLLIVVIATVVYFRIRPEKYAKTKDKLAKTKRSLAVRV